MLETWMKRVPEGKDSPTFLKEVHDYMHEYAEGADGYEVKWVNEENFDECWKEQENLKTSDQIREKYRDLSKQGKVVFIQIDW